MAHAFDLLGRDALSTIHATMDGAWGRYVGRARTAETDHHPHTWRLVHAAPLPADPHATAVDELLLSPFPAVVAAVASLLDRDPIDVEALVAVALCPPSGQGSELGDIERDGPLVALVAEVTATFRSALDDLEAGPGASDGVRELKVSAPLDAMAAIALGFRRSELPDGLVASCHRRWNALSIAGRHIDIVARAACVDLNHRFLYGQLYGNDDPMLALGMEGYGLSVAYSLAAGGCGAVHGHANCGKRRHDLTQWRPGVDKEPASLSYWLWNFIIGPRAPKAGSPIAGAPAVTVQAGALKDGVLLHSLTSVQVVKAIVAACRECGHDLDGVTARCLRAAEPRDTNQGCPLVASINRRRVVLHAVTTGVSPYLCRTCDAAVLATTGPCPGGDHQIDTTGFKHWSTCISTDVTHSAVSHFLPIDRPAGPNPGAYDADAVVAALVQAFRSMAADTEAIRHVVRQFDLDIEDVEAIVAANIKHIREQLALVDDDAIDLRDEDDPPREDER